MKAFTSLVLLVVVAAVVRGDEQKVKDKVNQVYNKCKDAHPITEEEKEHINKKDTIPDSRNAKCLMACMMREATFLRDGKYSKDNAFVMIDALHGDMPEEAEKAKKVVEACTTEVGIDAGSDECEYAYKMSVCAKEHAKKVGIKIPEF